MSVDNEMVGVVAITRQENETAQQSRLQHQPEPTQHQPEPTQHLVIKHKLQTKTCIKHGHKNTSIVGIVGGNDGDGKSQEHCHHQLPPSQPKSEQEQQEVKEILKKKPIKEAKLVELVNEDCPICLEPLSKLSIEFTRLTCCGNGLHIKCTTDLIKSSSLTIKQKHTCIMCRANHVKDGSEEDIRRLIAWVNKGKTWAMSMLAERYEDGVGVEKSDQKSNELYEIAAKKGNVVAQYNLGLFYHQGIHGLTKSHEKAFDLITDAANQGYPAAQYKLGLYYHQGTSGLTKSHEKAFDLFTAAASQCYPEAQYMLGLYYYTGIGGLTISQEKAFDLITDAAQQHYPEAQYMLGMMYVDGKGRNVTESKEWRATPGAAERLNQSMMNKSKKKQKTNAKCACGSGKKYKKCCRKSVRQKNN